MATAQDIIKAFNPAGIAAGAIHTVEFRSRFSPTTVVNVRDIGVKPPPWTAKLAKPTFIFTGPAGRFVIAPFGEAAEGVGTAATIGLVLSLVGLGYLLGRGSKR